MITVFMMSEIKSTRADIVAQFKRDIQNKTYKVKSQEIADKITQKMKEDESFITPRKAGRFTA